MKRYISTLLFLCLTFTGIYADEQDSVPRKIIHVIGLDFKPAYTFPTKGFFKGENMAKSPIRTNLSGHIKYGFKFAPNSYMGKMYPNTIQGIGIGYNTFYNTKEVGNPLAVYVFQTSQIASITPNLSFDYEWNFGASFGWKKYDAEKNPYNTIVGSKANAYINLGFLLNWQITKEVAFRAGIGLSHYSNGNTSYPNFGVNTLDGRIGLMWCPQNNPDSRYQRNNRLAVTPKYGFKPYINYDVIIYGATKKKGIMWEEGSGTVIPGVFAVAGLNFSPMYNFNKYFRAGLSLDAQYDESANITDHLANTDTPTDDLKFFRPPFIEQFSMGLSVRAEVVMPIFSINLGIGKNFICRGKDINSFYQNFVLKTDITRNVFLHVGYQLYKFKNPNNLMLGIGYRFNADRNRY
ncbi:acyloxyacyl hydrolase [uncultured Bacteroides sp.]|uniref:acyloxyacyl hydrolase n=1 Tax=uncultured Bacteroides sp. TaxID=162156 RepID=UPI0025FC91C5|nr:acyloxyacyl hydrolase [uncultured Bacteroides sp.]